MTFHEMLAVVDMAEALHEKPLSEGGHDGPLTMTCFMPYLRESSAAIGYPPYTLVQQFTRAWEKLITMGWIEYCDDRCGEGHFFLTERGAAQLREWNEKGCVAHMKKAGRKPHKRDCAAPEVVKMAARGT
jgi:hypothetical protein